MRTSVAALAVLVATSLPARAVAAPQDFAVDPVHSQMGFKVRHLVAKTQGRFTDYQAVVTMDPADVAGTLKLRATLQATSVDTGNEKRDNHLRSADFFEVEKHPEIRFQSTGVTAKDDGTFAVQGDLTIKGVTKATTLRAEVIGSGSNPFTGMPMVGLGVTGKIDRKDFGILWNTALDSGGFVLGDDVELDIHVEASVPKAGG
jgi:polyisoprenoid-binding protein YceI